MTGTRHPERGLTLTELTIAMVLAAIVVVGIVGFYMNSQALWFDASTQAITQREGTLVLEAIGRDARQARRFTVTDPGDTTQCMLQITLPDSVGGLYDYYYWWQDSLIHEGTNPVSDDRGPMLQSRVERFVVTGDSSIVNIQNLQIISPQGQRISLSTTFSRRVH